jgi:hypothetical protein
MLQLTGRIYAGFVWGISSRIVDKASDESYTKAVCGKTVHTD